MQTTGTGDDAMTIEDRRRFKRLAIPNDTIAEDSEGHKLGVVTLAGGGGIQVEQLTAEGEHVLQPGSRVRITVIEPSIKGRHTVDVEVKYRSGGTAGLQFIAEAAGAGE